ncbi:hypothetical protein KACC15558_25880 [Brevibacterium ammoniilyticum]|uniref:DUF3618 domain-containing protein n=2 Tax=Brevibacterium TaxID=1696 RepID=A0ABP9U3X2_9MICO
MSPVTDPAEVARALAEHAERLDQAKSVLREHSEQVADVVDHLIRMPSSLGRVLDAAGDAFQEHGATAVTTTGSRSRGSMRAAFAGGLLATASSQASGLRSTLMGVGSEASSLVWPKHDPLAAEELRNYRSFLEQRERQLDADSDARPRAVRSQERDPIAHP